VTAERQVGVDAVLERREPQRLEPCALAHREGLVELGERGSAP
jgi:hypothetical protein